MPQRPLGYRRGSNAPRSVFSSPLRTPQPPLLLQLLQPMGLSYPRFDQPQEWQAEQPPATTSGAPHSGQVGAGAGSGGSSSPKRSTCASRLRARDTVTPLQPRSYARRETAATSSGAASAGDVTRLGTAAVYR